MYKYKIRIKNKEKDNLNFCQLIYQIKKINLLQYLVILIKNKRYRKINSKKIIIIINMIHYSFYFHLKYFIFSITLSVHYHILKQLIIV